MSAVRPDPHAPAHAPDGRPGRAIGREPKPPRAGSLPPPVHAPGGMLPAGQGAHTPFASSQVDLGSNVAPSSATSMRVVTIVTGLMFMVGMAFVGALLVLVVGLFGMQMADKGKAAAAGKDKSHVRDTGAVEEVDLQKVRVGKGKAKAAQEDAERDPMKEMFGGLGAAPVTVYTQGSNKDLYKQIEIVCAQVNFRKRATLVNDKAHIPIVPAARCQLVFQGNVPLKTWITGGDTVRCTLQPIVCTKLN